MLVRNPTARVGKARENSPTGVGNAREKSGPLLSHHRENRHDPVGGRGGYVNPETGRSYHIDPGGTYKKGVEPPRVDVNRVKGDLPKRKYPLE